MTEKELKELIEKHQLYSKEREADNLRYLANAERNLDEDIARTLRKAQSEINKEIDHFIMKYADENGISIIEARAIVDRADLKELSERAEEYIRLKYNEPNYRQPLSPQAQRELEFYQLKQNTSRLELLDKEIDLALYKSGNGLEEIIDKHLMRIGIREMRRQNQFLNLFTPNAKQLQRNARILADASYHGTYWSDDVWKWQEELRQNLGEGLERTLIKGENPNKWRHTLNQFVQDEFTNVDFATRRIAYTETGRIQTQVQETSFAEAGFEYCEIIEEADACAVCYSHAVESRKAPIKLNEVVIGFNVPTFHPFCKCTISPVYIPRTLI